MGRAEAGSLKAMANKMKSKGLQRLRWYCQMCSKQCRDENGFKCHMTSEGHLRQMRLFAENPSTFVDDFSSTFEKGFLDTLNHGHGTKRTSVNRVYQEYIQDKEHVHMNSTTWSSLTGFCMYLGREGKAVVDETEKGWFIQYIDRDPATLRRQAADAKRKQGDMDEAEYMRRMIDAQIAAAQEMHDSDSEEEIDETKFALRRDESNAQPIALTLKPASSSSSSVIAGDSKKRKFNPLFNDDEDESTSTTANAIPSSTIVDQPKKLSAIEQLILDEENKKKSTLRAADAKSRTDYWLAPGIIVKILNKQLLNGELYKCKACVTRVKDRYVAELKVLESSQPYPRGLTSSSVIAIDQSELETVIPKPGLAVLIVNGYGRGNRATLLRIDDAKFTASLRVTDVESHLKGVEINDVALEDICKLA